MIPVLRAWTSGGQPAHFFSFGFTRTNDALTSA